MKSGGQAPTEDNVTNTGLLVGAAVLGAVPGAALAELHSPTYSHPSLPPPVESSGLSCPQYHEYGHALHLYITWTRGEVDLVTLTVSFSLYLVKPPEVHAPGQLKEPPPCEGGVMTPEHRPTTSHACFQKSDLESRTGVNASCEQYWLLGQLLHSNTIPRLDTRSPGS